MANNQIIKQVFGNHNAMRQYLDFLNGADVLPPFRPVLYREVNVGWPGDIETIMNNAKSHHRAKNRQVKNQLIQQFELYSQLQRVE